MILGSPATERAVDIVLRGPLIEAAAREVANHGVVERALTQMLEATTLEGDCVSARDASLLGRVAHRFLGSAGPP